MYQAALAELVGQGFQRCGGALLRRGSWHCGWQVRRGHYGLRGSRYADRMGTKGQRSQLAETGRVMASLLATRPWFSRGHTRVVPDAVVGPHNRERHDQAVRGYLVLRAVRDAVERH